MNVTSHLAIRICCAVLALAAGCASSDRRPIAKDDRVADAVAGDTPLDVLRGFPEFRARIGLGGELVRHSDGYRLASRRPTSFRSAGGALLATVPGRGGDPLRLEIDGWPELWVELRAEAQAPTTARVSGSAVVIEGAEVDTDVVVVVDPQGVEEIRLSRTPSAPTFARYAVKTGRGVSAVRVREGRIEALDHAGRVRIESAPVFIVDARGTRRDARASIEHDERGTHLITAWSTAGLSYPIAIDPAWSSAGVLVTKRVESAGVILSSGKVLITGGQSGGLLSSAEIYDPVLGTWTSAASMGSPRTVPTATLLPGGKVLVTGGSGPVFGYSTTEIYDPLTDTWTAGPNMAKDHVGHVAALLGTRVIIAGGAAYSSAAEAYDATTGLISAAGTMTVEARRYGIGAVLGPNTLLVAGGTTTGAVVLSTAEIYDATSNTWTAVGSMSDARSQFAGAMLSGGKVLVSGGFGATGVLATAETYDPVAKTWSPASSMAVSRSDHSLTLLPSGRVLAVDTTAAVYDAPSNTWIAASSPAVGHWKHVALPLASGAVLIASGGTTGIAELFQEQPLGSGCGAGGDCTSLSCVDKVCCNTACTGSCQACDVGGSLGTCSPVTGVPHGTRSCGAYACAAGSCRTTCSIAADCVPADYCAGTACVARKANGSVCTASDECTSNKCIDGYCCNGACGDPCAACDVAGKLGTCSPVVGTPHGARPACSGVGPGTTCGIACNGLDTSKCNYAPTSAPCGSDACAAGIETHASTCDAKGACSDVPKACGFFSCGAKTCKSSCTTKTDCIAGYFCSGGACVPAVGLGTSCTDASSCSSGLFCTEGVCCGVAACDAGSSCANPGKKGTCTKSNGIACALDAECGSNTCADSFCCDSRCAGQCEACDATGKIGVCSPVTGAPHGTRAKCDDGGADVCKARSCDGAADATKCTGFSSSASTECKASTCAGSSFTPHSTCDGAGACTTPAASSCLPYTCDDKGCRKKCAAPEHCAPGFECKDSVCSPKSGAHCSDDGLSSIPTVGSPVSCSPYHCGPDGKCATSCAASTDCGTGFVCDLARSECVAATPADQPTGSSGGCSMGTATSGPAPWALVALGALLLRRRRRSRGHGGSAFALATVIAAFSACATSRVDETSGERARARTSTSSDREAARGALTTLRTFSAFAQRLRPQRSLARINGGFGPAATAGPYAAVSPLDVTLPATAGGAVRLTPKACPDAWIELEPETARDVALEETDAAALVGVDAWTDTDLALIAESAIVEEVRLVRSADAPRRATWRLGRGLGVADVRVDGGRVRVFDVVGQARIESAPMFLVDARGVRRDVSVRLEGLDRLVAEWSIDGLTFPIAVDPAWSAVGSLTVARDLFAAVPLASGKILALGGANSGLSVIHSVAEIYDPSTKVWTTVKPMPTGRAGHSATRLPSGRVLVYGGVTSSGYLTSADLYDPSTDAWSSAAPAKYSRHRHTATMLADGKSVLFAGWSDFAEIYDSSADAWTTVGTLVTSRYRHRAVKLGSGLVLLAGGVTGSTELSSAELYDPSSTTFAGTGAMSTHRDEPGMTLLPSGKVLVAGGIEVAVTGYKYYSTAEVYDPSSKVWTTVGSMGIQRVGAASALLPSGRVLVAGGDIGSLLIGDVFDPATGSFVSTSAVPSIYQTPAAFALADGSALLFGSGSAAVFTPLANGTACTAAGDCSSARCVDGVCCDAACTGACQACDVGGALGTCSDVSGKPHAARTCGAYVCNAGACRTTCTSSSDCADGRYCAGGACVPKKAIAGACVLGEECTSGNCADGYCCDSACGGQCQACDVAGSQGTCKSVSGVPHGTRAACSGVGLGSTCGIACNGVDGSKCNYAPATTTPCGANACLDGLETHAGTCDGAGKCNDSPKACGAYGCASTTCKTSCSAKSDCAPGYFCSGSACTPVVGLGTPCTDVSGCSAGLFCTDSVCCAVASCGAGRRCDSPTKKGTCAKILAAPCAIDAECGSGVCADSFCCDRACDGQCEACDLAGKVGACTPVSGVPHGARSKCADGSGDLCGARTCDGAKDTKSCAGFTSGPTTACKDAACSGSSFTGPSTCDGAGKCMAPAATACAPYLCNAAGCRKSCDTTADCATGFECKAGKCEAKPDVRCEPDGQSSRAGDGTVTPCAPYRCGTDGRCQDRCGASGDCAAGFVCDTTSKLCTQTTDTGSSGGCSLGAHADQSGDLTMPMILAAFVASAFARRRRAYLDPRGR